ncbi:hypothetical protein BCR41DRAFT_358434 [Lobosporangium transversale]|uniref:Uncharacterized protein n=1 Tax=Lobosporangium transversale TaxID=64571 RepID=A0A1Y2GFZ8_9FUNG|nr:hypothetical protein BCR41DRAFT_358434 [Lobosporangium transversale]ORZ09761.1 hypothetical protein BCR41DRAFT_358434 [Lobosporangium transversale]|eukprot:XP_021879031.1 hypothetical protein BCR41DRAFT_358434 [Lobosporangium transversale]
MNQRSVTSAFSLSIRLLVGPFLLAFFFFLSTRPNFPSLGLLSFLPSLFFSFVLSSFPFFLRLLPTPVASQPNWYPYRSPGKKNFYLACSRWLSLVCSMTSICYTIEYKNTQSASHHANSFIPST